jgi:hypothetical protein
MPIIAYYPICLYICKWSLSVCFCFILKKSLKAFIYFSDRGIGNLHLKILNNGERTQLVRADTSLGKY